MCSASGYVVHQCSFGEKQRKLEVKEPEVKDIPTQQVEKFLQEWQEALVEYEKFNNRRAIREAKRLIKEFETELASRSAEA